MEIAGMILFVLILTAGVVVIPFGIAGTFIIVGAVTGYGLLTGFEQVSPQFCGLLLGLALAVELIEALLGAVLASRFGGSNPIRTAASSGPLR